MNGWRFTLSRRWLGYLGLVVIFAIACAALSVWQFDRRAQTRAEIDRVERNWDAPPRPLTDVLDDLQAFNDQFKWASVSMSGRYLPEQALLVRGRPRDTRAGFEQLVPLRLDDGSVFVIDRGWLPAGNAQDAPDVIPPIPAGSVEVIARLKPGEPVLPGRSAPAGQIATVNLPTIADGIGAATYTGAYGLLTSETPNAVRPTAVQKPVADEGPHLSYAFQWIAFGVLGFIGLAWAVRQEYRIRNASDPAERDRAARRKVRQLRRPRGDSEIEDAVLDRSH